jgi:hypothetical protein
LGPAQCYSNDLVGFRQPQRLPTARRVTACRADAVPTALSRPRQRASDADARVAAASTCSACNRSYRVRSPRTGAHLPSSSHHRRIPAQLQPIHRRSSALRDAAPQADHRVACRAINRCHRPLLRPITDGSPPPELPRAPPRAPLPPVLLQPSHHSVRSPTTHRPSTARQQPPSTYGSRCHR